MLQLSDRRTQRDAFFQSGGERTKYDPRSLRDSKEKDLDREKEKLIQVGVRSSFESIGGHFHLL